MKTKGIKMLKAVTAVVLTLTASFCVVWRLPYVIGRGESAALAAAAFTLTDGKYRAESGTQPSQTEPVRQAIASQPSTARTEPSTANPDNKKTPDKGGYYDSFAPHTGEARYSVAEKTYGADGTYVSGAYIKNSAGLDVDFNAVLGEPLTFKVAKNSAEPQVLIYHTHTGESYLDEDVDYFYESYYSRTNNNGFNVVAVGDAIAEGLESRGIKTLHDATVHDSSYNGSYDRSAETVQTDMEENSGIKVVLDIHRDALGTEECKVKPVFEYGGKKAAQIMILSGCDPDNERGFSRWQNNLSFALKLQTTAERMFPGMTRPVSFDYFAYNEYICDGSLLIEVGTDANSIEEAKYSGELLAQVLAEVLTG